MEHWLCRISKWQRLQKRRCHTIALNRKYSNRDQSHCARSAATRGGCGTLSVPIIFFEWERLLLTRRSRKMHWHGPRSDGVRSSESYELGVDN
jgi:hypothetical protein